MRFAIAILLLILPTSLWAQKVALVVGNSRYDSVSQLDNPANDSAAVAAMLARQGFEVTRADDLGRAAFYDALRDFRRKADQSEYALFYYAGHGIEVAGENYLVPTDAVLEDERDASVEMIAMSVILRQIGGASRLKMVMLDACRNNPFVARMKRENTGRSVGQGLANVSSAESDTLIAYAAAAGEITPDGEAGSNSPFTTAFLTAMDGPPADIRRVLGHVRDEMRRTVPGAAPFVYSSLGGAEYVLNPNSERAAPTVVAEPVPLDPLTQILPDFARAERAGTVEAWDAFLTRYAALNYHVLYGLAAEKRDSLSRTAALIPRAPVAPEAQSEPDAMADEPPRPSLVLVTPEPDRDTQLKDLQTLLRDRKCYRGAIDGIFGRGSSRGLARLAREMKDDDLVYSADTDSAGLTRLITRIKAAPEAVCPVARSQPRRTRTPTPRVATQPTPQRQEQPAKTVSGTSGVRNAPVQIPGYELCSSPRC